VEELAFRGFILSGLQSSGKNLRAIIVSSLLFGIAQSILQQSIITFFVGCMLGFLAVRTGSIIPCILYHLVHNGLTVGLSLVDDDVLWTYPLLKILYARSASGEYEYALGPATVMTVLGVLMFVWFWMYKPPAASANPERNQVRTRFETFVARINAR
jgi:sodium transport system permease protein